MTEPLKLTANLWSLPSRAMRYNAGVLSSAGEAWLIDPGPHHDEVGEAADLAIGLGARIKSIILTHSHWDHILGPERLPDVPVIAHEQFEATLARGWAATLTVIGRWEERAGYQRDEPFSPPFLRAALADGQILALGELELQLLHIPGHAADQLAIFEPASGALWAADTLSDCEIPFVSHSLAAYEATLERLAGLPIKVLVPGHGDPTTESAAIGARIDADRAYLAALRDGVAGVVRAGGSVAEAVAACAAIALKLPEENAGPHRLNVESAYIELGGDADPARVGWAQLGLIDE